MKHSVKVVAFDADDTLWSNEPYFQQVEQRFCALLTEYGSAQELSEELFRTEMDNLEQFGYGAKSFTLSMIETALRVSRRHIPSDTIAELLELGKSLLDMPIVPYPEVADTLSQLRGKGCYRLIVATKGDPRDQERKLLRSGLAHCFSHIEIMPDKTEKEYTRLLKTLHTHPQEFLMIGNSLKSDIRPVLTLGGYGVYIPSEVMWQHEVVDQFEHPRMRQVDRFGDLLQIL